jgi:Uma2 family endonuclease
MSSSALAGKLRKRFTPGEYLIVERAAVEKSEYYDGEIFAMAGAQEPHNIVSGNILAMLLGSLRKRGCQSYGSDMKVGITQQGPFFYPDVSVACAERKFLRGRRDILLSPVVIVEVLSKSTQRFDRGIKLEEYQRMPTVQAILLISSDRASAEAHVREGSHWKRQVVTGLDKFIELPSPRCVLPLAEIYEGVNLRTQPKAIR